MRAAGLRDPRPVLREPDGTHSIGGYRGFGQFGYGRQGYHDYRRAFKWPVYTREWTDQGRINARPPQYGAPEGSYGTQPGESGGPAGEDYSHSLREDYHEYGDGYAVDRGYFEYLSNARTESLLKSAITSMDRGLAAFREGQYRDAADAFRLAADSNQGDPAARIYAGHSLFATGRYREGAKYLRSAFQLQPRIMYLTYNMRSDYRNPEEFDRQVAALEEALALSPRDEDRLFVLGYVQYYGGQRETAYFTFERLLRVNPRDRVAAQLMESCQPPDVIADRSPAVVRPRPGPSR